jgi:multiple sugar transport system permease protein
MARNKPKMTLKSAGFYGVLYTMLIVCAAITLVPFGYLICSSLKPSEIFFDDMFLPTSGLFEIDTSTGSLLLVDTTHMDGLESAVFDLNIEKVAGDNGEVVGQALIRATVSEVLGAEGEEIVYTFQLVDENNARIDQITDLLPRTGQTIRYRIAQGNAHGFLGIAWGQLTLKHFYRLFADEGFARPILNSTFFASVCGVLATLFSAMSGYALAKFRFRGRDSITNLVLAALVVPGALLLAPNYQLLYWFGMLDSYSGLIIPALAPAFGVYLFRQATINSVPNEMLESARIDGCGEIKIFFTFVLPLIRPMAGAFLLLTFLGCWNNFLNAQIVLQSPEKMPLAVAISQLRGVYGTDYGLIMAATVISIVPVLGLFLLLQKEFLSGLTAGAVKG